jgi:FkbM family methyltransferase
MNMIKTFVKSVTPNRLWTKLVFLRWESEYARICRRSKHLGFLPALLMETSKRVTSGFYGKRRNLRRLWLPEYNQPFYYRENTSDSDVISQVFGSREYEPTTHEVDVSLIVDCGANIGCTSFYYLHRYPQAHAIAIEPDWENYKMCRKNLDRFGDRVTVINAAVWPTKEMLKVERSGFRDGREWSFHIRPVEENELPDVQAISINEVFELTGRSTIDLLKIDIEGGERFLFQKGYESWLRRTRNIVLELHGRDCETTFFNALAPYTYEMTQFEELTYCRHLARE